MNKLIELKKRISELVPDTGGTFTDGVHAAVMAKPITLADVLMAFNNYNGYSVAIHSSGYIRADEFKDGKFITNKMDKEWQLDKDLDHQSPEVIELLHSLLVNE